jgi:hypothetical protein
VRHQRNRFIALIQSLPEFAHYFLHTRDKRRLVLDWSIPPAIVVKLLR